MANFSGHIIGTKQIINEFQSTKEIEENLEKLTATTNVHQYNTQTSMPLDNNHSMSKDSTLINIENGTIAEVRVSSNVTGILIPSNANQIVVRVIVPVYDGDEELIQDTSLVEWNVVS